MWIMIPDSATYISLANCLEEDAISHHCLRSQRMQLGSPGWLVGTSGGFPAPAPVPSLCQRCCGGSWCLPKEPALEVPQSTWAALACCGGSGKRGRLGTEGTLHPHRQCGLLRHPVVTAVPWGGPLSAGGLCPSLQCLKASLRSGWRAEGMLREGSTTMTSKCGRGCATSTWQGSPAPSIVLLIALLICK